MGRIYHQTVIDAYSSTVFAKLYSSKHAITSAEVLNDRFIPFFEKHEIPILQLLMDRGTEYKGRPENKKYELYLKFEIIEHNKTKVRRSESNGVCVRLHRTMQDEFYAVAFGKKPYQDLETLQGDLDEWMKHYNQERSHRGRYHYGKTPFETFQDSLNLAKQRKLNQANTAARLS